MSDTASQPDPTLALSVLVIAYNEEASLAGVVDEIRPVIERLAGGFEILIVDDGSRDATAQVASRLAAADKRIRVVTHDRNRGGGAAIRTGLAAAEHPFVFYMPGDGQFDPAGLPAYLAERSGADIVLGRRMNRTGGFMRRFNSASYRAIVKGLFAIPARDLNWCKLYRRDAFMKLAPKASSWFIDTEVLARAARAGLVMREVEVDERPRRAGRATGARPGAMLATARELWRLRRELGPGR